MPQFPGREDLEKWFEDKPPSQAAVLAMRCALRVIPGLSAIGSRDEPDIVLAVFRANALAWSAAVYPDQVKGLADAVASAARALDAAAAAADAASAIDAADVVHIAAHAVEAAANVEGAAIAAAAYAIGVASVQGALSGDVAFLDRGHSSVELARKDLWWSERPAWPLKQMDKLNSQLVRLGQNWQVWLDWYGCRLSGDNSFFLPDGIAKNLDLRIATQSDEWWERGVEAVNADVASWVEEAQREAQDWEWLSGNSYGLLMHGRDDAWGEEGTQMDRARIFEHSDDKVVDTLPSPDSEAAIEAIASLPTLIAYEEGVGKPARVGHVRGVRNSANGFLLWVAFDPRWKPIPAEELKKLYPKLGFRSSEPHRTHWAVKEIDLFEVLREAGYSASGAPSDELRGPIPNVRSPYEYEIGGDGRIRAVSDALGTIEVPPPRQPEDAKQRLAAARELADDLIGDLAAGSFQVRSTYKVKLQRYSKRLPHDHTGNIYSADGIIRQLRGDLEADIAYGISDTFARQLADLISHHQGCRAYFPDLISFYDDVRRGQLVEPPPLDALEGLRQVVEEFSPDVFDDSVADSLESLETSDSDAVSAPTHAGAESGEPSIISLPPDPIADVDPVRAEQHSKASVFNRIWGAMLKLEKGGKGLERADKAIGAYKKWIDPILDWLFNNWSG